MSVVWIAAVAAFVTSSAAADEVRHTARLAYRAPDESCPREEAFRLEVAQRLGYDPFAPAARTGFDVSIAAGAAGSPFSATLRELDQAGRVVGERHVSSATCASVVSNLALTVSIALESSEVGDAQEPVSPDVAPAPSPPVPVPPAPARAPVDADAWRWRAGLRVNGAVGVLPNPSVGAGLSVGMGRGRWALDVEGRYDTAASLDSGASHVQTSAVGLAVAPSFHARPLFVGPVLVGAALTSEGEKGVAPRRDTSFFAAVGARVGLEWEPIARLALFAALDGAVSVARVVVRAGNTELWSNPPLNAGVSTGLKLELP